MSIYRTSLGNTMDVTVTVTGDATNWTEEQNAAWYRIKNAGEKLKEAFTPKVPPTPAEIIAEAIPAMVHDGLVTANDVVRALNAAGLLIVGTGAKLDKPSPPECTADDRAAWGAIDCPVHGRHLA